MPRDASGNYTLPAGNPVVTQTIITSVWANSTMSDLGAEMTDSLSRNGKGSMQALLQLNDAGWAFNSENATGSYRQGAGDWRFKLLNTDYLRLLSSPSPLVRIPSGVALKSESMVQLGYGGLKVDTPKTVSWTISSSHGKVTGYDSGSYATPLDVTQNVAGSTITIQPGSWMISANLSGRISPLITTDGRYLSIQIRRSSNNVAFHTVRLIPVVVNNPIVSVTFGGVIERSTATEIELALAFFGGGTLTFTDVDALEFYAWRTNKDET